MEKETTVKKYDFLIVGAGICGASAARILTDKGYKCLIVEKAGEVGGLCHDREINKIIVSTYGPHIVHTNDKYVWDFLNRFSKFNEYKHCEVIMKNDKLYHLPIDMLTMNQVFNTVSAKESFNIIDKEIKNYNVLTTSNLEDSIILRCGTTIYGALLKGYYEKKFGTKCSELAMSVPQSFPVSYNYMPTMYTDKYQGYPVEGYKRLVENMIGDDIDIMLNKDFIKMFDKLYEVAEAIVYTGPVDELCHYAYGPLKWCTAEFTSSDESIRGNYIYGCPVINVSNMRGYDDTYRITEHKWFTPERIGDRTFDTHNIITYERYKKWEPGDLTLYAIIDSDQVELFNKYYKFVKERWPNIILCGKNGSFDNYDICETIQGVMESFYTIEDKDKLDI